MEGIEFYVFILYFHEMTLDPLANLCSPNMEIVKKTKERE